MKKLLASIVLGLSLLTMENAIAVFESLLPEPWPLPVHGALTAVYLLTVGVGGWLVGTPAAADKASAAPSQGETP